MKNLKATFCGVAGKDIKRGDMVEIDKHGFLQPATEKTIKTIFKKRKTKKK